MVYFGVEDGTKAHRLYDPQHEKIQKIHASRDVAFEEEKKWDWCSVDNNKQIVIEFTILEEEVDARDLESALTAIPTNTHMSSPVIPIGMMDSLEQESLDESTRGSTTEDEPKKFCFLVEIYADTLEEE